MNFDVWLYSKMLIFLSRVQVVRNINVKLALNKVRVTTWNEPLWISQCLQHSPWHHQRVGPLLLWDHHLTYYMDSLFSPYANDAFLASRAILASVVFLGLFHPLRFVVIEKSPVKLITLRILWYSFRTEEQHGNPTPMSFFFLYSKLLWLIDYQVFFLAHARKKLSVDCQLFYSNYSFILCNCQYVKLKRRLNFLTKQPIQ